MEEFKQTKFPDFLKKFLNELSYKPTFVKAFAGRIPEEEDTLENRYLLFGYEFPAENKFDDTVFKQFENREPVKGDLLFGDYGHYQHDRILGIQINFEKEEALIKTGICLGPYCKSSKKRYRSIPKHSRELVKQLFIDYKKWLEKAD